MRSRTDVVGRITDMLDAIDAIETAIRGHDATTFPTDRTVRDAVLWNLTVLVERGPVVRCGLDQMVHERRLPHLPRPDDGDQGRVAKRFT